MAGWRTLAALLAVCVAGGLLLEVQADEEDALDDDGSDDGDEDWRRDDDLGGMVEPEEIMALKVRANDGDGVAAFELGDVCQDSLGA